MTPEKWTRIKDLFYLVSEDPECDADALLEQECGDDQVLRGEVERLLGQHRKAENFLAVPAVRLSTGTALPAFQHERFDLGSFLGSGGFGDVFSAFDRETRTQVALKRLRVQDPESIVRFKSEFRSVSRLHHPNLVRLYELVQEGGYWFLTMELLDGCNIRQALEVLTGEERERGIRDFLEQIAAGLTFLHQADILHRDLKPSNVWLTSTGRLVLLDFGLAKNLGDAPDEHSRNALGTPDYVAPEQISGGPLTAASDWYSAGVILYQLLTGRFPFEGGMVQVMAEKQASEARRPSGIAPDTPADLDDLCAGLLRRDPVLRFGAEQVMACAGKASDQRRLRTPGRASESARRVRGDELRALETALQDTDRGSAIAVHVVGESGIGKSWLVRRFLDSVRASDSRTVILQGRCYESESVAYEAFDGLLDDVARYLKSLPPHEVDAVLPANMDALAQVFPVFSPLASQRRTRRKPVEGGDAVDQRRRAFQAVRELLARLAERRRLILFVDDLHWGDADSIPLFREILCGPNVPPFLLIVAFRSEDAVSSELLRWLRAQSPSGALETRVLQCSALSAEQSRDLARALLNLREGEGDRELLQIALDAEGSPFLIHQFVRQLLEEPSAERSKLALDTALSSRIGALDSASRTALEVIAIAEAPAPEKVIYDALGIAGGGLEIRSTLTSKQFVRARRTATGLDFDIYHARIREAIVAHLQPARKLHLHLRLAQALERVEPADAERIARHYRMAGENGKAYEYTLRAAQRASQLLAFDRAARLYRQSLAIAPEGSQDAAIRIQLGDALSNSGRGGEAAEAYFQAAALMPADNLRLRILATQQLLRSGHIDEGMRGLRQTMLEAGVGYPESRARLILSIVYHRSLIRLRMRNWPPRGHSIRPVPTRRQSEQMEVCWSGALGISMFDPVRSAEFSARHLAWALDYNDRYRLCLALAGEATQSMPDGFRAGDPGKLLARARDLADELGDPRAIAFVAGMSAIAASLRGEWRNCLRESERAVDLFNACGMAGGWERVTAQMFALSSRMLMGRWTEVGDAIPRLIQEAEERGDRYAAINFTLLSNGYAVHLAADHPERARDEARQALERWGQPRYDLQRHYAACAELDAELYLGHGEQAWKLAQSMWRQLERSGLMRLQILRVYAGFIHGKCAVAAAVSHPANSRARLKCLEQEDAAGQAIAAEKAPFATPVSTVLAACAAATRGDRKRAIELLEQAEPSLLAADTIPLAEACRMRRAALLAPGPERAELARQAMLWMRRQRVVNVPRLLDFITPGDWTSIGSDYTDLLEGEL